MNLEEQKPERVQESRAKKEAEIASYTPEKWEGVKKYLTTTKFPEALFNENTKTDYGFSQHTDDKKTHDLISYVLSTNRNWVFEYEWRVAYCPQCKKVIHKLGTALNKVGNISYTRWFIRNGKNNTGVRVENVIPSDIFDNKLSIGNA